MLGTAPWPGAMTGHPAVVGQMNVLDDIALKNPDITLGLKTHLMLHCAQSIPLQQENGTLCYKASKIVRASQNLLPDPCLLADQHEHDHGHFFYPETQNTSLMGCCST